MSNRPRPTPEHRLPTRRQLAAQQREANVQRRVTLMLGGVLGLALLLIAAGFVYDRLYLPSRAIRQVNNATLTRGDYEQLARTTLIEQMIQTLQFSKLFGANQSFGQGGRFDEQIVSANLQLADYGTSRSRQQPVDESVVSRWVERQIVDQRAREEFGIEPETGAINQRIVGVLSPLIETPAPMETTGPVTGTATIEPVATSDAAEDAPAEATAEATAEPAAASPPTAAAEPTATPLPEEATQQTEQIVDALYDEYINILEAQSEDAPQRQRTPYMTRDDIAQTLRAQFREDVIRELVGEQLVPDLASAEEGEVTQINVRHILLRVPPEPEEAEEPETPDAEATTTPEETATAEPTATPEPTPTPTPEELEQLFAERKQEADELYQQLLANPDSFAEVATERSEDPGSAVQGGDLGAIDRDGNVVGGQGGSFVPEFVEAAWQLDEGEISEPVRSDFGWHIIQRTPEDPDDKLTRLRNEAFDRWIEEQREQVTIVPAPTPTPTDIPIPTLEPDAEATPEATTTP